MFSSTVSASNSEKCWNTMPTPSLRAARGLAMRTGVPSQTISPESGRENAVDHLDQRRLAGAVLAEQSVNLARLDGQADIVVGQNARKLLAYAAQLQARFHIPVFSHPAPAPARKIRPRPAHDASSAPSAQAGACAPGSV